MAALLLGLAGCQSDSAAPGAATPTAPRTPTPVLTPTPVFEAEVLELNLLPGTRPGDWRVLGVLENASDFAVADIQLRVWLEDPRGQQLAETTLLPALAHLGPGEATPFLADFQGVGAVTGAQAAVLLARRAPLQRIAARVSQPELFLAEDGSTLLLGTITNPTSRPMAIDGLVYLGVDGDGRPQALTLIQAAPSWLEASGSSPFLARVEAVGRALRWVAYADASASDEVPEPGIELVGAAELRQTGQGLPFVVGLLTNSDDRSRLPVVLLSIRHREQVLALAALSGPFPIGPGEQLPFGQDEFPGLFGRLHELELDPAELEVVAWVDRRASAPSPDHRSQLEVRIESLESVGSAVFLRGAVVNPQSVTVSRPSLYAAVRGTDGELLTAGWRELAARLAGGSRLEFVVDLPLPQGIDPAMSEFDVLAFGLGP